MTQFQCGNYFNNLIGFQNLGFFMNLMCNLNYKYLNQIISYFIAIVAYIIDFIIVAHYWPSEIYLKYFNIIFLINLIERESIASTHL